MDIKEIAQKFLQMIVSGQIDEAYDAYVDMNGRHHNVFSPAGMAGLRQAMKDNDAKFPHTTLTVKHVIAEGDMVAAHSHLVLQPGTDGMIVMHLLRFQDDKIVEIWDCGQPIPADAVNPETF